MKKILILLIVCLTFCAYGGETMSDLVNKNSSFALDLYHQLKGPDNNLFYSPISISTALAMTYAGARGSTAEQIAAALRFPVQQTELHPLFSEMQAHFQYIQKNKELQLNINNALWIQDGYKILPGFQELCDKFYASNLFLLDFRVQAENSRQKINAWIEEKTQGKITDLLAPGLISDMTRLIITNTIYFKAEWIRQFNPANTRDKDFYLLSEEKIQVPMMNQSDFFGYWENDLLQALKLPYQGKAISMVILLPKQKTGLPQLEAKLNLKNLQSWTTNFETKKVRVYIPKFKLAGSFNLKDSLQTMGMADPFTSAADFSGIESQRELFIGAVAHKAFIDVDEAGTEAAAATAIVMEAMAAPIRTQPPEFRADHPFIFFIFDNLIGSILFMGRLQNPNQ